MQEPRALTSTWIVVELFLGFFPAWESLQTSQFVIRLQIPASGCPFLVLSAENLVWVIGTPVCLIIASP